MSEMAIQFGVAISGAGAICMAEKYWKRRLKRAFSDTVGPLGWNRHSLVVGGQVTLVFLLIVWLLLGGEAVRAEVGIVAATVAALGVVFIGNFLWNYIAVPARMQAEVDQLAKTLQSRLDRVSNKQDAVDAPSDLLSEGIHEIWNCEVNTDDDLRTLEDFWENWRARVVARLEADFTRSDVIHFSRLGVIPVRERTGVYDEVHRLLLMHYALQEERLREIIRDHNVTRI